ncbi:hypothetical protein Vadar_013050 [Vaccinium darrowii]|uniref:Uncharacterized protein n=1 Tax=Vaccinium darrowii TaxID=229202 RepID=A0ACB7Y6R4_9ERIC|nr:hypothetical protein Vadar_013050 [Vaccinium darrowii]
MRYTVCDIFEATGRHWHLDDKFEYSLNPNLRYTPTVVTTMRREYQYRIELSKVLIFDCRPLNIPIPYRRAVGMATDTPELLQRALHCFREQVNRMQMRLSRYNYQLLANEQREEGLMAEACFYMEANMNEDIQSDIEMFDDDM